MALPIPEAGTLGAIVAVLFGLAAALFGARALAILTRPPTGEATRELLFITARELVPAITLVGIALFVEWVEWTLMMLEQLALYDVPDLAIYANILQALMLGVAGVLAAKTLTPYTRARRYRRRQVTLDRLAARLTLIRGRR